ncbi:PAS domain S-box protein [Limisalsivibrio acetivorans]|uniref:PAS domain S-box protein n=1 Tax=Limisalsivibrio acetivorans TaxID=1304888 RepID=UPI0003B57B9C|nr:PAS domain S-box protein [Limisalsivibrio acetivorans]
MAKKIVGIGSSAGGLEALKLLIPKLPVDMDIAYIIAQHLSPKHHSMLSSLLKNSTVMDVKNAEDGIDPSPNTIYVTPPNRDVFIKDGRIMLREPGHAIGPKPSVDNLFVSMAEDDLDKPIGIILSGTGSDGSHGVRAIKAAEGFVLCQGKESAKYNGMPTAAIATGCVDHIMEPEDMGQEIAQLLRAAPPIKQDEVSSTEQDYIGEILRSVKKRTGYSFFEYKPNTILRRMSQRMSAIKVSTVQDYSDYIKRNPNEADALCKNILISVTSFFRDIDVFKNLSEVVKSFIKCEKGARSPRIWIPACSTGEEVYSIAITLSEALGRDLHSCNIKIFGTDIDMEALEVARKGLYTDAAVSGLDKRILNRYFSMEDSRWRVSKSLRELIIFAKQDVTADPPFSNMDIISCRNLLIYFKPELQKKVLQLFHYSLNNGGFLVLGRSESPWNESDLFETVDDRNRIYRKKRHWHTSSAESSGKMPPMPSQTSDKRSREKKSGKTLLSPGVAMSQTLAEQYAPPSVLVDVNHNVIQVSGKVDRFLKLAHGEASLSVTKMIDDRLALELKGLLLKCAKDGDNCKGNAVVVEDKHNNKTSIRLCVSPVHLSSSDDDDPYYLISFEETSIGSKQSDSIPTNRESDDKISELEQDLIATREHLQTVIEEYETTNEELQALNEELHSSNEELQSTNEELETSNEELQSTNEEMITVNEELQVKTIELARSREIYINIAKNYLNGAIMLYDTDLRFSIAEGKGLEGYGIEKSALEGKKVWDSMGEHFCAEVVPHMNEALEGKVSRFEHRLGEEWLQIITLPIKGYKGEIEQGMIICNVITDIKKTQNNLEENRNLLQAVFDRSVSGIVLSDLEGRVLMANPAFCNMVGVTEESILGNRVSELSVDEDHDKGTEYNRQLLNGEIESYSTEKRFRRPDGNEVWTSIGVSLIKGTDNEPVNRLAIVKDISSIVEQREEIERRRDYLQNILDSQSSMIATTNGYILKSCNKNLLEFSGYSSLEDFKRDHQCVCDLFLDEDGYISGHDSGEWLRQLIINTAEEKDSKVLMKDVRTDEIRTFLVDYRVSPLKLDEQNQDEYIVSFTDITEVIKYQTLLQDMNQNLEKRVSERTVELEDAKRRIEESNRILADAQQIAHYGSFEWDIPNNRVIWSEEAYRMMGLEPQSSELTFDSFKSFVHTDDIDFIDEVIEKQLVSGGTMEFQYRIIRVDGETRSIDAISRVEMDRDDIPVRMYGVFHDITDRITAEQEIKKNENLLQSLFDVSKVGICLTDENGNFIRVNNAYCEINGYEAGELLGNHFTMMVPEEHKGYMLDLYTSFLEGKHVELPYEWQNRRKDGSLVPLIVSAGRIEQPDGSAYKVTTISDISQLKSLEKEKEQQQQMLIQQSKMAAMGEMIGVIAHQWKQPLNAVGLLSQMIETEFTEGSLTTEDLKDSMENIQNQVDFMSQTVDNFREFFKPSVQTVPFCLYKSVQDVLGLIEPQLTKFNVKHSVELEDQTLMERMVCGLPNEFKQVVLNLIVNAKDAVQEKWKREGRKAGEMGIVRILFSDRDGRISVRIEDDGGGIPDEVLGNLFEAYFTTKGEEGTGIGLYMAKMIVEGKMNGELNAFNIEGGACFEIILDPCRNC